MLKRSSGLVVSCLALLSGCSAASQDPSQPIEVSAAAYTVSYRNAIRVPAHGTVLEAQAFATQIKTLDPAQGIRCAANDAAGFGDLTSYLGGITWTHPAGIIRDASLPPLYSGRRGPDYGYGADASAGAAAEASAAPNIERPDLVGVQGGIAIFLSKQHGLISVDTRGPQPQLSCAMKLPGEPMNFLFRGNEIVVVVNARGGGARSALLRFAVDNGAFRFVDAVRFDDQRVVDARLFDSTIVAYTSWTKPQAPYMPSSPTPAGAGSPSGGRGEPSSGGSMAAPSPSQPYGGGNQLGTKVLVVQWDDALKIDWEDSLMNDPVAVDPLQGKDPNTEFEKGQLVAEAKSYLGFVAASDRYLAVPRTVRQTRFSHMETYTYQVCSNYNPRAEQVQSCNVNYERKPNPDYRAPNPSTGDYACEGKALADCIKQAAPTVSQYIYVPVGQTCQQVWIGRCEAYETRSTTYPRFKDEEATELTVYRFEAGSFTKLDGSLSKMVEKQGALAFEQGPLSVKGLIQNRNQVQFQNGHLYMFADNALQTLAVAGNSIAYIKRLDVAASTQSNPSVVFSADRAMISSPGPYNGSMSQSQVAMLDLTSPALPKTITQFVMAGQSTQLMMAAGGILGPGQVSFQNGGVGRNLQKLTLFSRDNGSELDNLLLGTEYDAFASSWFGATDDQRIRLGSNGRIFLPYSGRHHADQYEATAHRLNISRIDGARLVSERSFNVSDEIIRTASVNDDRSLAFGDSATYQVDRNSASGTWEISTLREFFTPFATYRLNDQDLHARISRVGTKCRITTHAGITGIFGDDKLAQVELPCGSGYPTGFGPSVLFAETRTGVTISADGRTITVLPAAEVAAKLDAVPKDTYCFLEGVPYSGPVAQLDAVPAKVFCEKIPVADSTWARPSR